MNAELNCAMMTSREATHAYLKEMLVFPDYYGENLDALFDLLTSCVDTEIRLQNLHALEENLGSYGGALLQTFLDAAAENPNLQLSITRKK